MASAVSGGSRSRHSVRELVMTANSDQANGRFSIGGKVGEWVQGIDRTGAPLIYPLTVTRSPFNPRAFVERSEALSVLINWEALEDHSKTRRAILELADAYGFTHNCNYRIVIHGSPPRGKGLGVKREPTRFETGYFQHDTQFDQYS